MDIEIHLSSAGHAALQRLLHPHPPQFDCSDAELAERVERRAADRKRIDGEKRMRRELDRHIWRRKEFEDQRLARGERRHAKQIAMRDAAQAEWQAFNGSATAEQIETFKKKYRSLVIWWSVPLKPVSIIPTPLPLPPGPPMPDNPLPVPMLGRGELQSKHLAGILASVPRVERTAEHPSMPETGHPLRDAINAAIPGIMADPSAHTDALAAIHVVHPQTAGLLGNLTPQVIARAEGLSQEVEHVLLSGSYSRDGRTGRIESDNPDNVRVLLAALGIEIQFNAWIERVELRGWRWPAWTELSDAVAATLLTRAAQTGTRFTPAVEFFWRTLRAIAHENEQDPACDVLDQLQNRWDGTARLSFWLSHACGVPADEYHQAVSATILLGLVARIRRPGVKFDLMPVFVSEQQGTSKSTLARMLALNDDWFTENVRLGDEAKELVLALAGKSVAEVSEMRSRGEVDAVKAMISATHDEGRPAYGRATVKHPRRNIFIGTTNRLEFLEDPTGGRRFLPIVVQGEIHLEWVRENLPQLIGEAATKQAQGVDINLPREVWALAGEHQAAATSKSSVEVLLEGWFGGDEPCWIRSENLVLLLRQALGREPSRGSYSAAMRNLKFVNKTRRDGKDVPRAWVRGDPGPDVSGFGVQLSPNGRPTLQWSPTDMPNRQWSPPEMPPCPVPMPATP